VNDQRHTEEPARLIDLRPRLPGTSNPAEAARHQIVKVRQSLGEDHEQFANRLNQAVEWEVTPELVSCWETEITPPGDVVIAAQSFVRDGEAPSSVERDLAGVEAVFRNRSEFMVAMPPESLFDGVELVEAAGLSHNLLCQHYPTPKLRSLLDRGAEIEAMFLQPYGEAIAQREEEEGFAIGNLSTLTELNVNTLLTQVRTQLEPSALPRLRIGTYDQTLRLNMIFLDDQVCICQPYLHAIRGLDTPTFVVRNSEQDGVYESLRSCYRWLRSSARFL